MSTISQGVAPTPPVSEGVAPTPPVSEGVARSLQTASDSDESVAVETARSATRRRQNLLLIASLGMLVASFMPWLETGFGTYNGFAGAGRYLFYVAWIGIAGALVPSRRLAAIQAGIVAIAGVALPSWQCLHLLRLVGLDGWVPGTGMLIIFASGWLALRAAVGLVRD